MTRILGISALYHDAAAALVVDGTVVAAAQEERFTRKKHDERIPESAIAYCLEEAGITAEQLDYVIFYDKPLRTFERLLETWLAFAPTGFASFRHAAPQWLRKKLYVGRLLSKQLEGYKRRFLYAEHHKAHAAAAFFPSPFDEAAVLTMDGVGEWATATIGRGEGNRVKLLKQLSFPHSLGLLYTAFTFYCGFKVNSGEYKLMGLAPYGRPVYADRITEHLMDLKEDGSFRLDQSYFRYCTGLTMTSPKFHELFGGPPRTPGDPLTQHHMDVAASVQKVTEEIMLRAARTAHELTGSSKLCLAGGVALNCVANGRILREGPFEEVWIQPAAGDAGSALGAALHVWHELLDKERPDPARDAQQGSLLGPAWDEDEARSILTAEGAVIEPAEDEDALCATIAEELAAGRVVGWMQGRMEFGPRALGNRSILGDARDPEMQLRINRKVKFRESFRPFAPVVLADRCSEWFELDSDSPYMLLVAPVKDAQPLDPAMPPEEKYRLLQTERSRVSAVTHVDASARVQTVDEERNPRFHKLLTSFHEKTGCPVLINTSFNVRGEPIVAGPADAWACFCGTDIDTLVVDRFVMRKEAQTIEAKTAHAEHAASFPAD